MQNVLLHLPVSKHMCLRFFNEDTEGEPCSLKKHRINWLVFICNNEEEVLKLSLEGHRMLSFTLEPASLNASFVVLHNLRNP